MKLFDIKKWRMLLAVALVLGVALVSCKKHDYLTDGGTAKATTTYSTYDYLAVHPDHYFDTVVLIIDHFGLKDSLNKAGTFFAPTDFAVNLLMKNIGVTTLDSLYNHVTSKVLTQYMFSDSSITLANATVNAVAHTNWADTINGIKKTAYTYTTVSTFTYYILQYVKVNGYLDGSADAPAGDLTDAVLNCQTTGIKTSSGTTLHVLANNVSMSIR